MQSKFSLLVDAIHGEQLVKINQHFITSPFVAAVTSLSHIIMCNLIAKMFLHILIAKWIINWYQITVRKQIKILKIMNIMKTTIMNNEYTKYNECNEDEYSEFNDKCTEYNELETKLQHIYYIYCISTV